MSTRVVDELIELLTLERLEENLFRGTSPDTQLVLSEVAVATIGLAFLAVLPLGLAAAGFVIWYRRRRR